MIFSTGAPARITCILFAILTLLLATLAPAPTHARDTGDGSQEPSPEFSVNDLSSLNDVALPDLFTGTMKYNVPIPLPSGLNGLQPKVTIVYRSTNSNGWLGMGWDMPIGVIVQKYAATTTSMPCSSSDPKTVCKPVVITTPPTLCAYR